MFTITNANKERDLCQCCMEGFSIKRDPCAAIDATAIENGLWIQAQVKKGID